MKKICCFLFATMLSMGAMAQIETDSYVFFDGTFTELQTRALNANRPYFVFVYANWSLPAKRMYQETFQNEQFIDYAEAKWIGMDIDGESIISEGREIAEQFNVLFFPSVLFFTPEGKFLDKLPGFRSAAEMLAKMKQLENERGAPEPTLEVPEDGTSTQKEGEYLFKVSARLLDREGFGVQMGVFSNYRNVFTKILELENEHFHRNVTVFIKEMGGDALSYKVILGPFPNQNQAQSYLNSLRSKDPGYYGNSMVVNLADL